MQLANDISHAGYSRPLQAAKTMDLSPVLAEKIILSVYPPIIRSPSTTLAVSQGELDAFQVVGSRRLPGLRRDRHQHDFVRDHRHGAAKKGLLGFAVERATRRRTSASHVRASRCSSRSSPSPTRTRRSAPGDHPVQSFVWDDFTAKPDRDYEYYFHPLRGQAEEPRPHRRRRSRIRVHTEPLFSTDEHDIFFNRGVASSQAYARQFGNKKPSKLSRAQAGARRSSG